MKIQYLHAGLASAFLCKSNKKQTKRTNVVLSLLLPVLVSSVFLAVGAPYLTLYQRQQLYHTPAKAGRTLLWDKRIIDVDDKLYVTGYIFGVFSAGFYVFARVPQIVKNVSLDLSLSLPLPGALCMSLSFCVIVLTMAFYNSSCVVLWRVSLCTCSFCQSLAMSLMVWAFSSTQWMASFSSRSCPGWWAAWEQWSLT